MLTLAIKRLVAKACDTHEIPFVKNHPHPIDSYLAQTVNNFTHPEGVTDINSFLTRGLEEDRIEERCSVAGVEYLPPAQRETTKETQERRHLMMEWCRDAKSKIQLKSPPEKIGIQPRARTLNEVQSKAHDSGLRKRLDLVSFAKSVSIPDDITSVSQLKWAMQPFKLRAILQPCWVLSPGEALRRMGGKFKGNTDGRSVMIQYLKLPNVDDGLCKCVEDHPLLPFERKSIDGCAILNEDHLERYIKEQSETSTKNRLEAMRLFVKRVFDHAKKLEEKVVSVSPVAAAPIEREAQLQLLKAQMQLNAQQANNMAAQAQHQQGGVNTGGMQKKASPPFRLEGTLSYSDSYEIPRIHIIRGEWTSKTGPQSFELFRRIPLDEDLTELPKDGEYEGSFNYPVANRKSKGKAKPRTQVVMESGVKLRFTANDGKEGKFSVIGSGANVFGVFRLDGTATKNTTREGDETFSLLLGKKYVAPPLKKEKTTKRKHESTSPPQESNGMAKRHIAGSDHQLAASLQREEVRLAKEEDDMLSTPQGIAYMFVERVLKECKKLQPDQNVGIKSVAVDDMVHQAEGMLKCQQTFKSMGKDSTVDIGYHFTKASAMSHIQRDGLMTMSDREANPKLSPHQSRSRHGGGVFGDGVYTGNNPFTFMRYGDIGLLVARLRGKTRRIKPEECELAGTLLNPIVTPKGPLGQEAISKGYDSLIGNKTRSTTPNHDEVVLLRSMQCIPLIRFPVSVVSNIHNGIIPPDLLPYVNAMEKVVAEFFNSKRSSLSQSNQSNPIQRKMSSYHANALVPAMSGSSNANRGISTGVASAAAPSNATTKTVQWRMSSPQAKAFVTAATGASNTNKGMAGSPNASMKTAQTEQNIPSALMGREVVIYDAPEKLPHSCLVEDLNGNDVLALADQKCTICLEKLAKSSDLLKVKKCQHIFCRECILQSLQICRKCPSCQNHIGEPQGKSPSGQMIIVVDDTTRCAGYDNFKTIVIVYDLCDGKQKIYHEEEGKQFKGTRRIAYLPDNDDGRRLLERLKYAFRCGLTFCVGTSATSGKRDVITWGSIHHKTSPCNGSHGWPDETYFVRCNRELDCLGVPKVDKVGYL